MGQLVGPHSAMLIVNVASRCSMTASQYPMLQRMHDQFRRRRFSVVAFPCNQFASQEPLSAIEVQEWACDVHGVTFPIMAKVHVKGPKKHELFQYLVDNTGGAEIKWNFTKFVVDRQGFVAQRLEPGASEAEVADAIRKVL